MDGTERAFGKWERTKLPMGLTDGIIFSLCRGRQRESSMKSTGFAVFPTIFFARSFCAMITQTRLNYLPCWCRMKKSSAECIPYITYTGSEDDSGKLPGMTELAKIQMRVWHIFADSPADKMAER